MFLVRPYDADADDHSSNIITFDKLSDYCGDDDDDDEGDCAPKHKGPFILFEVEEERSDSGF